MRSATLVLSMLLALALSTPAAAQSVPKEIRDFKRIGVAFSENAPNCNLAHEEMYVERVKQRLAEIGIPQSDRSDVFIAVGVSGAKFGMLGGYCATNTQLTFQTILMAANIVTNDPEVRAAVDRLGQFPVVLYESAMFGVQPQTQPSAGGPSTTSRDAVLGMIDKLVEGFAEARK